MGKQRKKTLQELMQERATGTGNQSVYTTEPRKQSTSVKSQVDKLYKRNANQQSSNITDKVNKKFLEITNRIDTNNKLLNTSASMQIDNKTQNQLAEMDPKERFDYLSKYVRPQTNKEYQDIQLGVKAKQGEKLAEEINKKEGLSKALPTAKYFAKEFAENTVSSFGNIKASANNLLGRDRNNEEIEFIKKYQEAISSTQQNLDSSLIKTVGQGFAGFGQQMPQLLLGGPLGKAGSLIAGVSSGLNEYNERMLTYPEEKTKNILSSTVKGVLAGGLDKITNGLSSKIFGEGILDKTAKNFIKSNFKSKLSQFVASKGYEVLGQIGEEEIENLSGYVVDKAFYDEDVTVAEMIEEAKETFKQTGMTTILMDIFGLGGSTYSEIRQDVENEQKQQATMTNKTISEQEQQTALPQAKNAEKQTSQQPLGNEKYSIKMPDSNYKFEKTGNANEDNLDETMSKYFNNSEDTKKLNTTLKTIMKDKGLSIVFDANIRDEQGNVLDGKYENGTITINPNSTKAFEYVATHELTHAIGTKEMLKMVEKYRTSNKEFNSKLETILKNYNKSELTEEALADVSAELFGTQEFIANVKNTNPNLFQKIYNEIKYLWHQFRGYKNQNQFVEDLYNKWTQAYNSDAKLNQTTRNLNIGLKGFENAGKELLKPENGKYTRKYRDLTNNVRKAVKMAIDGKSGEEILKATDGKWTKNTENNQVMFNISDKDINVIKPLQKNNKTTLGEIIEHPELFFYYPELKNMPVVTERIVVNKKDQDAYYSDEEQNIHLHNNLIRDVFQIKSNLIHEIQHAIQDIEGTLTRDNYSLTDKEYLNNILEIEADDQVERFIKERKGKQLDKLTEINKKRPSHSEYRKKNIIEKIPVAMYNIVNGYNGVVNQNETNKEFLKSNSNNNINTNSSGKIYNRNINTTNNKEYIQNTKRSIEKGYFSKSKKETEGLEESSSFNLQKNKEKQLEIIQKTNPMHDDYHTGIRSIEDIKTYQEALNDDLDGEIQDLTPDFKADELRKALETGEITVYSSYPIEQGVFVTPSKMEAGSYAGNINKVYSKKIKLSDVAWIDTLQGQYAKVEDTNVVKDNKGRTLSKEQQDYFKDSKIRDENGNLLTMYHGSNSEFTVFDLSKSGQASKESKVGFWFTESDKGAKNFADNVWYGDKKPTTYEVYLNLKNPKVYEPKNSSQDRLKLREEINHYQSEMRTIKEKYEYADTTLQDVIRLNNYANAYGMTLEKFMETRDVKKEDIPELVEAFNKYTELQKKVSETERILDNTGYDDSYEQFKTDLYSMVGQSARDANLGGLGMSLNDYSAMEKLRNHLIEQGYDGIVIKNTRYDADSFGGKNNQYVAFNPNQIKKVDNLNPTENPDIRYSKQNADWYDYVQSTFGTEGTRTTKEQIRLPETNVLQENTSNLKPTTTKKETDEEIAKVFSTPVTRQKPKDRKWAIIKANVFDKGIVFEDLSKKAKNRELEAKWDYTLSSSARGQYAIGNARYDENGKQISKGLTEIIDEVGDKIDDFQNYMYHLLNIDRMTLKERFGIDNKPVFGKNIGKDYSERKVEEFEKANPKFKEWAQDVYDYANADKAELVKNGVISQELSDKFAEMYPHYVPIQRANKLSNAINLPLDTRRTGVNTPIKQAKGGSSDLNPLFETLAGRTMQTYRASARNSLGVELKNTLESLNSLNSNVNDAESLDSIMDTISDEKTSNELLQASKDGKLPTFTVFDNGNKVTFDISEDIYDALKPTSEILKSKSKILNAIGNLRRAVLTEYNPLFSITNTLKDTQDVLLNSQHALATYKKYPEAYWQIMKNGYWKQEYIQNGGEQNTYFKDGEFEKVTKKGLLKQVVTFPLDAISKVNSAMEMAPRLAEYIASREQGRSIQTSMLDASRVTTNFKAGGDFTKALNRNGATFLNAGVQGTMQTIRNIREANAQGLKGWAVLACKMAVAGAPVLILNHLMWEDDEDYEQLQDYVKDGYYIIGKRNDGTFIRIPKGRTLAVIQKIVGNVDKYINNKQELNIDNVSKDFWESIKFAIENVAPNNPLDNNVISPIIQAITNTSWYGEDIVPERLQNVPTREQYDETTDKFSRWLGEKTGVSPMKINYLLDQYGGGVSDVLLPLGTPQAENTPIEDKFTTDPVMKSKYPGEFFEKANELEVASNSMYATDTDIVKGKYMSYIQGNMSDLYKEKREIQNSTASDEEKKRQLKEVQRQINETAQMAMKDVEKPKMTSTTALIGNEEFYKNSDGEWERLKDKDKIENVSMKSYSDYKLKKEQALDNKRKEKNNDKATLNDTEMIEIIKSSNYTDKEKDALFDDQINDKTYKHLKLLNNNNISKINQYMDYKTADLDSDKKDDGTMKGKTISGTKKKKITTYLNNSSFNGIERLYLYGQTYELSSSQRKTFDNYVNKLELTREEKKEIYLDLASSNVVEMSDGSIRWK